MNSLMEYIENGQGRGLKKFAVFTLVFCLLMGIILNIAFYKTIEPKIQDFFKQTTAIEIKDGQIVFPKDTYIAVPLMDGEDGGFVLDTLNPNPKMAFQNGMYLTTNKVFLKSGNQVTESSFDEIKYSVITQQTAEQYIRKTMGVLALFMAVVSFIVLWIVYGLLYFVVKLFFLILGRTTCPYLRGRAVFVAWSLIATLGFILFLFGYGFSITTAFALALILAIIIVFKTPLHSMDMEESLNAVMQMPVMPDDETTVISSKPMVKKSGQSTVKSSAKSVKPIVKAGAKKTPAKPAGKKELVKKAVKKVPAKPAAKKMVAQSTPKAKPAMKKSGKK